MWNSKNRRIRSCFVHIFSIVYNIVINKYQQLALNVIFFWHFFVGCWHTCITAFRYNCIDSNRRRACKSTCSNFTCTNSSIAYYLWDKPTDIDDDQSNFRWENGRESERKIWRKNKRYKIEINKNLSYWIKLLFLNRPYCQGRLLFIWIRACNVAHIEK